MGEHAEFIIGIVVTCVLGIIGLLGTRSLTAIDKEIDDQNTNIKELWRVLNDLSDELHSQELRISINEERISNLRNTPKH